jgi:hypothetical protein
MKKVAMTVVGVLALAGSANAGGTWYTDQVLWQSLVTNVRTADYASVVTGTTVIENGVTASAQSGMYFGLGCLSTASDVPITFTFSGNAFSTQCFVHTGRQGQQAGIIKFSIDGSLTNFYDLPTPASGNTFLGYISDSSSAISVTATPSTNRNLYIDSFSFGNGTNPSAGGNVAPEPGTLALALTGGCALVGMYIRRRMSN